MDGVIPPQKESEKKSTVGEKTGQAVQTTGSVIKTTAAAGQATGAAVKTTGRGIEVASRGVEVASKGVSAMGKGVSSGSQATIRAGAGLSSTVVGAVAGVPLIIAGGIGAVVGGGMQAGGAVGQAAGKGGRYVGKGVANTGSGIQKTSGGIKSVGNGIKSVGGNIKSGARLASNAASLATPMGAAKSAGKIGIKSAGKAFIASGSMLLGKNKAQKIPGQRNRISKLYAALIYFVTVCCELLGMLPILGWVVSLIGYITVIVLFGVVGVIFIGKPKRLGYSAASIIISYTPFLGLVPGEMTILAYFVIKDVRSEDAAYNQALQMRYAQEQQEDEFRMQQAMWLMSMRQQRIDQEEQEDQEEVGYNMAAY